MSAIPPLLPPGDPEGGDDFRPAPWGLGATAYGILTTFFVLMALGGIYVFGCKAAGVSTDSVAFRYCALLLAAVSFVVVPLGAARMSPAGLRTLGFMRPVHGTTRAIVESAGIGALLLALAQGYDKLLETVAPAAAKALAEEAARQADLLDLPWPLLVILAVVVAPLCEELLFRGFIFGGLRGPLGFAVASGIAAVLFAIAHWIGWATIAFFVIGLGCAAAYERHRSLVAAIVTHATYNGLSLAVEKLFPGS